MDPRVACLRLGAGALTLPDWVVVVPDEQGLIDSGANTFLLDGHNPVAALSAVERIRKTPRTSIAPVFYTHAQGARFFVLADRMVQSCEELLPTAQGLLASTSELNIPAILQSGDFRLLAWLYTRRSEELLPVADPFSPSIYSYPIAECFAENGTNVVYWLHNLQAQGQLIPGRLIDRIRLCPKCGGSHLNFVDVCPSCRSIAISQRELIHCLSCGRIGDVDEFTKEHSLRCPFCSALLRQPGTDYDRPADSFICSDCDGHFAEPEVLAACYECGAQNATQELFVRTYHSYRLTEKGQVSARVGQLEVAWSLFDQLGNVTPSYFEQFLNWNLTLTRRYPDEPFTLLALRLVNMEAAADALGGQRVTQLIDTLVARLKDLLRTTDVTSRFSPETLWLLLPRTSAENGEIVRKRILELNGSSALNGVPPFRTRVERFTFPGDTDRSEMRDTLTARDIIFRVNARLAEDREDETQ